MKSLMALLCMVMLMSCQGSSDQIITTDYKAKYYELREQVMKRQLNRNQLDSIRGLLYPIKYLSQDSSVILQENYDHNNNSSFGFCNQYGHAVRLHYHNDSLIGILLFDNIPKAPFFGGNEETYWESKMEYDWRPSLAFEYYTHQSVYSDNLEGITFGFRNPEHHYPTPMGTALFFDSNANLDCILNTTKLRQWKTIYCVSDETAIGVWSHPSNIKPERFSENKTN